MNEQDNFSGGFLLGTLVGGIVGGFVGAYLVSRQVNQETAEGDPSLPDSAAKPLQAKTTQPWRLFKVSNGRPDMEIARRNLETKIAQLNEAIDDVRQQLGGVNGASETGTEQPSSKQS